MCCLGLCLLDGICERLPYRLGTSGWCIYSRSGGGGGYSEDMKVLSSGPATVHLLCGRQPEADSFVASQRQEKKRVLRSEANKGSEPQCGESIFSEKWGYEILKKVLPQSITFCYFAAVLCTAPRSESLAYKVSVHHGKTSIWQP